MKNVYVYDVRESVTGHYDDGTVLTEKYATTWHNGEEWCVDENGVPEFPIGNKSADTDEIIAVNLSLEEMKAVLANSVSIK